MENIHTIKESLIYSTLYVQMSLRNFIITRLSANSDPEVFKLIPNVH